MNEMELRKSHIKEILITVSLTALVGEIYFYPFNVGFRFTAGVIIVSFLFLYFPTIPEMMLLTSAGTGVFIFRVLLGTVLRRHSFGFLIELHYPAFFYYFAYGIFLKLGKVRSLLTNPVGFIAAMAVADMGANFVELMIRYKMQIKYFQRVLTPALGVALIRSVTTFSIYWFVERHRLIIQAEEHQKRYSQLLELVSELKAEFFYIKKSSDYLERAMKEAYNIYQKLNCGNLDNPDIYPIKRQALSLAKDIHEIKKDYLRITAGIGALLPEEEQEAMTIKSIVQIIEHNTCRILKATGKQVEIETMIEIDFSTTKYLSLFTILNNLVYNSIEAIQKGGYVKIAVEEEREYISFMVSDNGIGIDPKDLPFIFEPGFSTKYTKDGDLSTGVGLTHVKNLAEDIGGKVIAKSKLGQGTTIIVNIPILGNFELLPSIAKG